MASALLLGVFAGASPAASVEEDSTNIVVLLLDDVGTDFLSMYDDLNPYSTDLPYTHGAPGGGDIPGNGLGSSHLYIQCPNLDSLAQQGVLFTNAYAMPYCSPTRACLLTGNYPVHHGVGQVIRADHAGGALEEFGDPGFELQTLAELVQSQGYQAALFGKWHLGATRVDMDPGEGDDSHLGWASIPQRGHFDYWHAVFNGVNTAPTPPSAAWIGTYYDWYWNRNHSTQAELEADPDSEVFDFATVVQLDEAMEWCNQASEPFLCYVTTNAVHAPWGDLPPEELVATEEYEQLPVNAFTGYAANFESLDAKIGDFMAGMDSEVRDNTLFIVMGDNGTPRFPLFHARLTGSDGNTVGSGKDLGDTYDYLIDSPQPRFKGSVYEKGTRVPMIVAGKGVVNGGRSCEALVNVVDVFPTVAELIGATPTNEVQGISFLPLLQDNISAQDHARDDTFCEVFSPNGATGPGELLDERKLGYSLWIPGVGRYKLVLDLVAKSEEFYQLQDAAGGYVDPFETVPLPHEFGHPNHAHYVQVLQRLAEIAPEAVSAWGHLALSPTESFVQAGDEFELQLVISSNGVEPVEYGAIDALLQYDPEVLMLLGIDDALASHAWMVSDFLPDPDGINLDTTDGCALYTALCSPGDPALADPSGSIVTTLRFFALQEVEETVVSLLSSTETFAETEVYSYDVPGGTLTGNISTCAKVYIGTVPISYCSGVVGICPCSNEGSSGEGCANSTGTGAALAATAGTSSVEHDSLVLTVSNMPAFQFGIVYMGTAEISALPFGDGMRCVGGSVVRFPPSNSGPAASISVGPGIVTAGAPIAANTTWYFQGWYRDPAGPCGEAYNFTNALSVSFSP